MSRIEAAEGVGGQTPLSRGVADQETKTAQMKLALGSRIDRRQAVLG